jgi:hypothetical protein
MRDSHLPPAFSQAPQSLGRTLHKAGFCSVELQKITAAIDCLQKVRFCNVELQREDY